MKKGELAVQRSKKLKQTVAQNIKSRREALGMTQAELARRAKVTARYISVLEDAARPKNLTLETLDAICRELRVSVCELVCDPGPAMHSKKAALEAAQELIQRELAALT